VAWRHYGLETNAARSRYHFRSGRVGGFLPESPGEVARDLTREIPPGTMLQLSFAARREREGGGVEVRLRAVGKKGETLAESQRQVTGRKWRRYSIGLQVPTATASIFYSLRVSGSSRGEIDEVRLEESAPMAHPILQSDSFDRDPPGEMPQDWFEPVDSRAAGFRARVDMSYPFQGRGSLLLDRAAPAPLPDPGKPAILELGGGVSALVPVALYRDREGTLPHLAKPMDPFPEAKPKGFEPSGNDRATRLADLLLLGSALENFYPYEDVKPSLSEHFAEALEAAAEDPDERHFLDTLRRLTHVLADGHADATYPSDPRYFRLPLLWTSIGDSLVVTRVTPEASGMQPGDLVLEIDGKRAAEAVAAAEALVSGASAGDRRFRALEFLASGRQGDERHLLLQRGGDKPFNVTLRSTQHAFGAQRFRRTAPETVAEVRPGIFYLDLDRIDNDGFLGILPRLETAQGIIFDLRGYPEKIWPQVFLGRLLERPVSVRVGTEVRLRPDQPASLDTQRYFLPPTEKKLPARIVFLTDERAVSLAEFTLQFVAENHLTTLLGSPTAGTQGEIDEMILPGSYHVLWTGTRVLRSDGTSFRGLGVVPSILVRPSLAGITAQRDEVLDAAVSYLQGEPGTH
jgi:C-terminal processing protease CtpA/Prc